MKNQNSRFGVGDLFDRLNSKLYPRVARFDTKFAFQIKVPTPSRIPAPAWDVVTLIGALQNRRFHGRRRHLGSETKTAKFKVNVWEKS